MKIGLKELVGTKWKTLPIKELEGWSIITFMNKTDKICLAAVFDENDKPCMFVGNNKEELDKYKGKGVCFMVQEFVALWCLDYIPKIAAKVFPEGTLQMVEIPKEVDNTKTWW